MRGDDDRQRDLEDAVSAKAGDARAFERIYRRHLPRVHGTARWLLGTDDVDDAIQEAFVRVWTRLDTFNGTAALGTWLFRVATNVILRHRDKRGRRASREVAMALPLEPATTDRPDLRLDIETAVKALPERARAVFVLHEIEGLEHHEIASIMGTDVATSRSQLHRARRMVRKRLMGGDA